MGLGGDIFPSGHTANAVVTWGILAYLASTPRARRWLSALSAVTSLGVGLATVYLGTHWLSDVVLGWAAGLLILLALPWCEPLIARAEVAIFDLRDRWRERRTGTAPSPAAPVAVPVSFTSAATATTAQAEAAAAREAAAPARSPRAPVYLAPGPHSTRSERTPVTPVGSRRHLTRTVFPRRGGLDGPPAHRRLTSPDACAQATPAAGPRYAPPGSAPKAPVPKSRNRGLRRARPVLPERPSLSRRAPHAPRAPRSSAARSGTPW